MGPLELQLYRELAIQMVRTYSLYFLAKKPDDRRDLDLYRTWFKRQYDRWAATPRPELNGLTPAEAIVNERAQLPPPDEAPAHLGISRVELYTDLPQAEHIADRIEHEVMLAPDEAWDTWLPNLPLAEPTRPDTEPPPPAADDAHWVAFYNQYLRNWSDDSESNGEAIRNT